MLRLAVRKIDVIIDKIKLALGILKRKEADELNKKASEDIKEMDRLIFNGESNWMLNLCRDDDEGDDKECFPNDIEI